MFGLCRCIKCFEILLCLVSVSFRNVCMLKKLFGSLEIHSCVSSINAHDLILTSFCAKQGKICLSEMKNSDKTNLNLILDYDKIKQPVISI